MSSLCCPLQWLQPQCHPPEGHGPAGPVPGVPEESRIRPSDRESWLPFFFAKLFNGSVWVRAHMLVFISKEKASCCSFSVCWHENAERMTEMSFGYKLSNRMRRFFMFDRSWKVNLVTHESILSISMVDLFLSPHPLEWYLNCQGISNSFKSSDEFCKHSNAHMPTQLRVEQRMNY